jgi:hypothetical protein
MNRGMFSNALLYLPVSDLLLVPPHHREGAIVAGTTMSNNI